jgi:hypothetical protein
MKVNTSSQSIDDLIQGIEHVIRNRCSLLDEDVALLEKVVDLLKQHRRKWTGRDTTNLLLVVKAIELLTRFFLR